MAFTTHQGILTLLVFIDSNWAGDIENHKSTSSFVFCLSSSPVTWSCKKQHAHALSSIEARYRAIVLAIYEVLWLWQLMTEFGFSPNSSTFLWCDNQSAINISRNIVEHQRTKNIELHMHLIRNLIQDDSLSLEYILSIEQAVEIFTKPFTSPWYPQLHSMLGVKEVVLGGS